MTERLGLKGTELLLYALVYAFSQDDSGCFYGSNDYAAKKVGCARESVNRTLSALEKRGLLTRAEGQHKGRRTIDYVAIVPTEGCDNLSQCDKNSQDSVTKNHTKCDKKSHNNKEIINVNIDSTLSKNTSLKGGSRGKKKSSPRAVSEQPVKIQFADFVTLTQREHDLLVAKHGEEDAARCIEILNNYKGQEGKKYDSDFYAINNWVVKRLAEEKAKALKTSGIRTNERGETNTVASMRAANESLQRIADRYAKAEPEDLLELPPYDGEENY